MEIEIPAELKKRGDDYVSYTAIDKNGKRTKHDHVCYATHMQKLPEHSFELLPRRTAEDWKDWAIDGESYLRFVELFKDNGLIDPTVKAEIDDTGALKMHIPIGMSRHRVYSAMCAFRWAESLAPFVYTILKLSNDRKELSFWQILHYAMATQVASCGHNWCNIAQTRADCGYIYSCYGMGYNLGMSLCMPLFWYQTDEALAKLSGATHSQIDNIAIAVAPCKTKDGLKYGMALPTLLVSGSPDDKPMKNDVLNPMWTPLYKYTASMATCNYDAAVIQKELLAMYQEVIKDYEPIKKLRDKLENPKKNKWGEIIWE